MKTPPLIHFQLADTHRLIPSRFPPIGVFDAVATADDLNLVIELEGWTNDRLSAELGVLRTIPSSDWVVGRPHASVVMAAFCHPRSGGARFTDASRGAWYAALTLETAHSESIFHRTRELEEIGIFEARVEVRQYLADLAGVFHDARGNDLAFAAIYDPNSYRASQDFAQRLRGHEASEGIVYRSVRHSAGTCIVCFRPRLIMNVRAAAHFEYRWTGKPQPIVKRVRP